MIAAALLQLLAAQPAPPARPWPVEPVVGLAFVTTRQSLAISGGAEGSAMRERSEVPSISLGVRYPLWRRRIWMHGAVLLGYSALDAHAVLGLQKQALYRVELTRLLGLRLGLGLTFSIDAATPARSVGLASAVLGVQLHRVELLWAPGVQFPLGEDARAVGGAQLTARGAVDFVPLSFALRVSIGPRE